MYCKVCGNLLEESDLICKVCGADIEEQRGRTIEDAVLADVLPTEDSETYPEMSASDEDRADEEPAAFVPEPEEELAASVPEPAEEPAAFIPEPPLRPRPSAGEFQWNIHQFPSAKTRKTEDVNFDWNMPLSTPGAQARFDDGGGDADYEDDAPEPEPEDFIAEAEQAASAFIGMDDMDDMGFPAWLQEESAPDALRHSLDADSGKLNRERFFTFDKKNEEFQRLLDKEYERLKTYDSPMVNKARDMLAEWDLPASADGKRTDPGAAAEPEYKIGPEPEAEAELEAEPEPAPDARTGLKPEYTIRVESKPEHEYKIRVESEPEYKISIESEPEPELEPEPESEPEPEFKISIESEPEPEFKISIESEPGPEPEPAEGAALLAEQDAEDDGEDVDEDDGEETDITEAEFSISKALDSIEKEIEEWEGRDKLSTASKVAMIISVIFLTFTGGSAAVKYFAPHSSVDVWFDSVQLQAASTIKHGVDTIRDFFNDSGDGIQESEEGSNE
jgi:hypothetical protein